MPSSVPVGGIRMSVMTTSGACSLHHPEQLRQVGRHADELKVIISRDQAGYALPQQDVILG